ncbi:hypothetical protein ACH5RR_001113 [Cinchona calisaya]|uniref:RNase H type-1 domain-containing protein n=1 Tax=Cinchona calisaya TaxID=153742 RepID=A0ABD3B3N8_9GENT
MILRAVIPIGHNNERAIPNDALEHDLGILRIQVHSIHQKLNAWWLSILSTLDGQLVAILPLVICWQLWCACAFILFMVKDHGCMDVLIELDSQVLCHMILCGRSYSCCFGALIRKARALLAQVCFGFVHIYRETNLAADFAAKLDNGSLNFLLIFNLASAPWHLLGFVPLDAAQTPSIRLV